MYKNINDYELLYLIAENDEGAYNDMYSKYNEVVKIEANKLYSKFKQFGITKNELYQAGLYGLTQAIKNYDEYSGVTFYTCVCTYIVREMHTLIRNCSRYKHTILTNCVSLDREMDEEGNPLYMLIEDEVDIQNYYDEYVNSKKILDLKYNMSFFCSLVFELKINNFSNVEISKLLGVNYKKIDNALCRIKKTLKKDLNRLNSCDDVI